MKKYLYLLLALLLVMPLAAKKKDPKPQEVDSLGRKIKTGWNFGILPSVAYDADYGFQGGVLTNVYYYGDGSQYPEPSLLGTISDSVSIFGLVTAFADEKLP